ncbi:hypothetical protein GOBAR_AA25196 [Gossypium barbadense]|uniref:Ubiquitin-related modifier 1 homolog n=1 Tax=Gossypium barbadense TaxID=3634 RepID=A0A2P5WWL0_GOSBA|nr:hypothetical protein GOBAR_AA25196 [Gossypium barbadense]
MEISETSSQVMDWRKLFVANKDQSLQYFPPVNNNGSTMVAPPPEIFGAGVQRKTVKLLWAKFEATREARDWVLDHGPWHIQNKPVIVRKWEPGKKRLDFDLHKLPVRVHLSHIPLELYTGIGLSYVASAIGVPLYMYTITVGQSRLAYAKVCVEIDANQINPRTIDIVFKDDSTGTVWVEVPWMPQRCSKCSIFGYVDKGCPKKLKEINKVWVPKAKVVEAVGIGKSKLEIEAQDALLSDLSLVDGVFPENEAHSKSDLAAMVELQAKGTNKGKHKFGSLQGKVDQGQQNSSRKPRAVVAGVADLMKFLKQKGKNQVDRGKKGTNRSSKQKKIVDRISLLNVDIVDNVDLALVEQLTYLSKQYRDLLVAVESYYRQRLKPQEELAEEIVGYYKELLGVNDNKEAVPSVKFLKDLLPMTLSQVEQRDLMKPVGREEIKEAIFSRDGDKPPGPDGYASHIFKVALEIVHEDVIEAGQTQNSSWDWKKLMGLRNEAFQVFQVRDWLVQGQRYQVSKVWQEIRPKASKEPGTWRKRRAFITVVLSGGLELLCKSVKFHNVNVDLPKGADKLSMRDLLAWVRTNLIKERPEMFMKGESVRPGVLVLVNDCDWELSGQLDTTLEEKDVVVFISTLHGG